MNKLIELNKMDVEINVGEENLISLGRITQSGTNDTPSAKRRMCIKQSRVPNRYAQVVLTRTGKKPMAIAKDGNSLAVPVIAGNIIAQAKMSNSGQMMTICCTTVGTVDEQYLLLDSGTDDSVVDTIIKYATEIQQACYTVLCGEDFAYRKTKKQ